MNIAVVGMGYVGLVTAAVFSDFGHTVFGIGRDEKKIKLLRAGIIPFFESGLAELVQKNIKEGRLTFTVSYKDAIAKSKVIFVCVGTPSKNNGEIDLSQVFNSLASLSKYLVPNSVVVVKSTVPPGTCDKAYKIIKDNTKVNFEIASVPEFLREGSAISDSLYPDRIVIGADTQKARDVLLGLHKHINGRRVATDIKSAQMIKYVSNAFLAMKISFANSVAAVSERVGADVESVLDGIGLDKRIGRAFLYPGVGYGGSCFPKDVKGLINLSKRKGYDFDLLSETEIVNGKQIENFVGKVVKVLGNLRGKKIAILGLSFKPNTDDLREAPSLKIIDKLQKKGAKIIVFDPVAMEGAKKILSKVVFAKDVYEAVKGADGMLIVTEWNEFKELDLVRIKKLMKSAVIIDGRNIYEPKKVKELGFYYQGVGR